MFNFAGSIFISKVVQLIRGKLSKVATSGKYSDLEGTPDTDAFLQKTGGNLTGALNLANYTWNNVGDDVMFGDMNVRGTLCVKGLTGQTNIALFDWQTGNLLGDVIHTGNVNNYISNPNLLINPNFRINQRGAAGTIEAQINPDGTPKRTYFVDRWSIDEGSVTINADGSLTLNGTISQILENPIGGQTIASSNAGTAVYNDAAKKFTITGSGAIINWAKLEIGSRDTNFVPPDSATELLKCQRYFFKSSEEMSLLATSAGVLNGTLPFPATMRATPAIKIIQMRDSATNERKYPTRYNFIAQRNGIGTIYNLDVSLTTGHFYEVQYEADAEI